MSQTIQLLADDGHSLSAYEAGDPQNNGAALVVLQEIFGVNRHIRSVADDYAREGFLTVAPALFDRVRQGVELGYAPEDIEIARGVAAQLQEETILKDIVAAIAHARHRVKSGKVGVIGYCLGGSYAWLSATRLSATRLGVDAAVGYYGSKVARFIGEEPRCPVILHFGEKDKGIPLESVETIRQTRPGLPVYLYDAGHGFNCTDRPSYSESAATPARARSLEFLRKTLLE